MFFVCILASAQLLIPGLDTAASVGVSLPAGSARPAAMGGAFTAVADDPSAAAWNPAGVAQLKRPEVSISYDRFTVDLLSSAGDYSHVGFASITFPFKALTTQLTYRKLSTFPEITSSQSQLLPAGDIYDYSLSAAGTILGRLSVGVSVHHLDSDSEMNLISVEDGVSSSDRVEFAFSDLQLAFGLLLEVTEKMSLGGVYRTEATWPSGYAVGVAFRPVDRLILALDYSATKWSGTKILFDAQRDESAIRFGTEYVIVVADQLRLPIRAGYFHERRPISLFGGQHQPPDYDGWSLGGGMGFGNVRIDFGYVRTNGNETAEITTERLLLTLSVHF